MGTSGWLVYLRGKRYWFPVEGMGEATVEAIRDYLTPHLPPYDPGEVTAYWIDEYAKRLVEIEQFNKEHNFIP